MYELSGDSGSYCGYGTNEYDKPFKGLEKRPDIVNYLTQSVGRERWALAMRFLQETMYVEYNKNYVVTAEAVEYYKNEDVRCL